MISKDKKTSMSMFRKMSILPVAFVAIYLFACTGQAEQTPAIFNGKTVEEDFREFVYSNVVYPPIAMENGISGSVLIEFEIEKDGSIANAKVLRGVDPLLDAELLRVINSSPQWTPGQQRGKAVSAKYQFQYDFKLPEQTPAMAADSNTGDEEFFEILAKEDRPMFDGMEAETAFRDWVYTKVRYPVEAQEKGIQGRVIISFIIDKDGSVTNVKILRGVDPLLDNETLRVINLPAKWTPGKKDGKPVRVIYQFQLIFRLNS